MKTAQQDSPKASCLCVTEDRHAFMPWLLWCYDRQTWTNRELIVIDSSQEPVTLPARPDVRVVRVARGTSIPIKRNLALMEASGSHIAWFDDDDWQHPDRLKHLVSALEEGAKVAGCAGSWFVNLENEACRPHDNVSRIIFNSAVFETAVARSIGFNTGRIRASDSAWLQTIRDKNQNAMVCLKDEVLFFWLCHANNISNPASKRKGKCDIAELRSAVGEAGWGDTDDQLRQLRNRLGVPQPESRQATPSKRTKRRRRKDRYSKKPKPVETTEKRESSKPRKKHRRATRVQGPPKPPPKCTMQGIRILIVSSPFVPTPPPTYGGTQRDVALLAEALAYLGHDVTVIACQGSSVPGCTTLEAVPWKEGETAFNVRSNRGKIIHSFWAAVLEHLETSPPFDVVNSHAWLSGTPFSEIKKHCAHLCIGIHGGGAAPENSVFVSKAFRDARKPSAHFVHNPVDASKYRFRKKKEAYLSFVGRLDNAKGVDTAIRVAKMAGLPVKVGGNITDQKFFDRYVAPYLGDSVEYVGQVGGKTKSDLLGRSMAVVCPTRLNPEPFGRVPLEANACGTPAIAYDSGGLREVVRNDETGFLVKNGDVNGMADAVERVEQLDPRKCRSWVEDNFNPTLIAERYLALYQALINGQTWG